VTNNAANGVLLDDEYPESTEEPAINSFEGNIISANGADGIAVRAISYAGSQIEGNSLLRNFDDGIDITYPGVNVNDNRVWFNADLGIEAVPGTLGGGNRAKHNGDPAQCVPDYLCSSRGRP